MIPLVFLNRSFFVRYRRVCAVAIASICGISLALIVPEVPLWTLHGTRFVKTTPQGSVGRFPIILPDGTTIHVLGDSNASGGRIGRARAWPVQLRTALGERVLLSVRAAGGSTVLDAVAPHRRSVAPGDLCIIAYGSNDAAPRGWLSSREAVPADVFATAATRLAIACQAQGARVLFLAPPPAGSQAMDRRIQGYRRSMRQIARATHSHFLDPAEAFAIQRTDHHSPKLLRDALHLDPVAQKALAQWLGSHILISRPIDRLR